MTDAEAKSLDWALFFFWIMATTLGWVIGNMFFQGIPIVISGVAIAVLQWTVLYKRMPKSWQWAVYSSIAWIAGYIIFVIFVPEEMGYFFGPVIGAILGVVQWSILRREFELAGWWIVISIMAWTTGLVIMPGPLTSGALPGALTGLTLVLFFRYSRKEKLLTEAIG
jgi:hypothetical protein